MANEAVKLLKSRENGTGLPDFKEADDDDRALLGGVSLKGASTANRLVLLAADSTASFSLKFPIGQGTAGQTFTSNGDGTTAWSSAGTGDVVGPASSVDNTLPRFDGVTGKLLQGSGIVVDDSDNMSIPGRTHQQAGQRWAVSSTKTGAYTTLKTDYLIPVDTTSSAVTITLDVTPDVGQVHVIKDVGGNAQVNAISIASGVNIEGAAGPFTINSQRASLVLTYQGALGWIVI